MLYDFFEISAGRRLNWMSLLLRYLFYGNNFVIISFVSYFKFSFLPINLLPSGDPSVSCEPEFGDPNVLGVDAEPGDVIFGMPGADPGHICVGAGHGKPG